MFTHCTRAGYGVEIVAGWYGGMVLRAGRGVT